MVGGADASEAEEVRSSEPRCRRPGEVVVAERTASARLVSRGRHPSSRRRCGPGRSPARPRCHAERPARSGGGSGTGVGPTVPGVRAQAAAGPKRTSESKRTPGPSAQPRPARAGWPGWVRPRHWPSWSESSACSGWSWWARRPRSSPSACTGRHGRSWSARPCTWGSEPAYCSSSPAWTTGSGGRSGAPRAGDHGPVGGGARTPPRGVGRRIVTVDRVRDAPAAAVGADEAGAGRLRRRPVDPAGRPLGRPEDGHRARPGRARDIRGPHPQAARHGYGAGAQLHRLRHPVHGRRADGPDHEDPRRVRRLAVVVGPGRPLPTGPDPLLPQPGGQQVGDGLSGLAVTDRAGFRAHLRPGPGRRPARSTARCPTPTPTSSSRWWGRSSA